MDTNVKLLDELVFTKTGERLNSLQREVLRGSWYGKTYPEIAEEVHRTDGYVREVGAELWKLLSEVTGDTVDKGSFRAMAERLSSISDVHSNIASIVAIANDCSFSISTDSLNKVTQESQTPAPPAPVDRLPAPLPDLEGTVGRDHELATLSQWITQDHCRLIGVWGLPSVGKSRFAALLVDRLAPHFSAIAWATLTNTTHPAQLETAIATHLPPIEPTAPDEPPPKPPNLFDRLRHQRCLIVLDGLEAGFVGPAAAGTWQPAWEPVAHLLDQAARNRHASCFLVLSQETPITWSALEDKFRRTRSLPLGGLPPDALAVALRSNIAPQFSADIADPERLSDLTTAYRGHPAWIAAALKTTHQWFGDRLGDFLDFGSLLPAEIATSLAPLAQRLTDPERQALTHLAQQSEPIPLPQLRDRLTLSPTDSLHLLESLQRRSLLERGKFGQTTTISLSPVLQAWAIACLAA